MSTFALNVGLSAAVIGAVVWIAGRAPGLAGFVAMLPLTTMITLPLARAQFGEGGRTADLARSMLIAAPITLIFLAFFLLGQRLKLGFWASYALGAASLLPAFLLHRFTLGRL